MTETKQTWCEHIGGLGPPFPFCASCAADALWAKSRGIMQESNNIDPFNLTAGQKHLPCKTCGIVLGNHSAGALKAHGYDAPAKDIWIHDNADGDHRRFA